MSDNLIPLDLRVNYMVGSKFMTHLDYHKIRIYVESQQDYDEIINSSQDSNLFLSVDEVDQHETPGSVKCVLDQRDRMYESLAHIMSKKV